ncbi:hypothetical protein A9G11_08255 [Gilliamella sp. wkB108]|uniref:hypothetical protein n=1 Tax=Gilliamella sp. wkB108 TaxID=3120256 RepID=UPI00080DD658|nr:hypothetical protein [Gilliamella apicola]OCG21564.1 hypothetical protein A9G11_08255 [Gilliamella apicola]
MSINKVNALTAITAREVIGSLPYITFDEGQTKVTKLSSLLVMRNPDGRTFIPENDVTILFPNSIVDSSNPRNPIEVPAGTRWQDIGTFVPLSSGNDYNSMIDLNSVLGYNWQDPDGDNNFKATGTISLFWQDSSGADISNFVKMHQDWQLDPCDSPYRLTIAVTNSDFSTQYGIPREVKGNVGSSHTYYLRPKITTPYVCYARPPDVSNDSTSGSGLPDLNGSAWVAGKGFKPQDIYYPPKNFPTIGGEGLFFDLIIAGLTAQQVLEGYDNGILSGVNFEDNNPPKDGRENLNTRTVGDDGLIHTVGTSNLMAKLSIAPNQDINTGNKLRITISSNTGVVTLPIITRGSAFYIDYKATNTRLYSFKIKKWFFVADRICEDLYKKPLYIYAPMTYTYYHEPAISDLTNANGFTWNGGIPGRNINNYRREITSYSSYVFENHRNPWRPREYWGVNLINGGLFSEWGNITEATRPNSGFGQGGNYLTNNEYEKTPKRDNKGKIVKDKKGNIIYEYKYYTVASYDGRISKSSEAKHICMFFGATY